MPVFGTYVASLATCRAFRLREISAAHCLLAFLKSRGRSRVWGFRVARVIYLLERHQHPAQLLVCLAVPPTRVVLAAEENPERVVLQEFDLVGDLPDAVLQHLLHHLSGAAVRRGARSRRRSGEARRRAPGRAPGRAPRRRFSPSTRRRNAPQPPPPLISPPLNSPLRNSPPRRRCPLPAATPPDSDSCGRRQARTRQLLLPPGWTSAAVRSRRRCPRRRTRSRRTARPLNSPTLSSPRSRRTQHKSTPGPRQAKTQP